MLLLEPDKQLQQAYISIHSADYITDAVSIATTVCSIRVVIDIVNVLTNSPVHVDNRVMALCC